LVPSIGLQRSLHDAAVRFGLHPDDDVGHERQMIGRNASEFSRMAPQALDGP
jgi:hypothetical protein